MERVLSEDEVLALERTTLLSSLSAPSIVAVDASFGITPDCKLGWHFMEHLGDNLTTLDVQMAREAEMARKDEGEDSTEMQKKCFAATKLGFKMLAALRNLIPGPMDAGVVVELMRQHCDEDGALSREGFSAILLALREGGGSAEARAKEEKLKATWTLISQAGKKVKVAPFIGFACVARYRCPLVVQTGLFDEGNGISLAADEIGFAYPKMRTVEMLREEAKDRSAWVILDTTGEGLA